MKLRLSALLVSTALAATLAPQAHAQDRHAFIVVDSQTNQVVYEANAQARRFPASITKVMTIYMVFEAIEQGRINWDSRITFSRNASRQPPTKLGVRAGDSISVEEAVMALITRSANDVATAVAENLGGSEAAFARQMTERARQLGMSQTQFRNASGLPDRNQVSTAEDLAKLAIAIRRDFPHNFHLFSQQSFEFEGMTIAGHNRLLGAVDGVDGLKTGYTRASGFNLATTAGRGNQRMVVVVLGGASSEARNAEVRSLLETGFNAMGVTQFVHDVTSGASENLYDARDRGDLDALGSEVPVAVRPSAPVVFAGLPRSGRTMTMPAGRDTWQVPVQFAAMPGRSAASSLPTAAAIPSPVVMAAVTTVPSISSETEEAAGEPVSMVPASTSASGVPVQMARAGATAVPEVAPQSVLFAAVAPVPAPEPAGPTESVSPVVLAAVDPAPEPVVATDSPAAPSVTETVQLAEMAPVLPDAAVQGETPVDSAAPVVLAMVEPAPAGEGAIAPAAAIPETPVLLASSEIVREPLAATAGNPADAPVVSAEAMAEAWPAATPEPQPTAMRGVQLAAANPADLPAVSAAPGPDTPAVIEPVLADPPEPVMMAEVPVPAFSIPETAAPESSAPAETPVVLAEGAPASAEPSSGLELASVDLSTAVLPAAEGGASAAATPETAPVAMASVDPEALAETARLRAEAAEREAQRMAMIEAEEARAAEAARLARLERAARDAEARQRRLAEQRERDARERAVAEERARETRLAEERDARRRAADEEAARQRQLASMRGDSGVQIGAFRSEQEARSALRSAMRFAPPVARSEVSSVQTANGTFFRARFVGLATVAARALCSQISGGGGECQLIR